MSLNLFVLGHVAPKTNHAFIIYLDKYKAHVFFNKVNNQIYRVYSPVELKIWNKFDY